MCDVPTCIAACTRRLWQAACDGGQALAEYALILAVVAVLSVAGLQALRGSIGDTLGDVRKALKTVHGGGNGKGNNGVGNGNGGAVDTVPGKGG